jgi:hypothetical protein
MCISLPRRRPLRRSVGRERGASVQGPTEVLHQRFKSTTIIPNESTTCLFILLTKQLTYLSLLPHPPQPHTSLSFLHFTTNAPLPPQRPSRPIGPCAAAPPCPRYSKHDACRASLVGQPGGAANTWWRALAREFNVQLCFTRDLHKLREFKESSQLCFTRDLHTLLQIVKSSQIKDFRQRLSHISFYTHQVSST